ncbi:anti-sigma factor [Agromyces ramosus]|uniref:Regulator of SigK n=1 Tax=Agromyces ramosus TaxID=33879 RepID=A0ABU0R5S2_9MICO|nr:anti-sigma factor [Agromyces ramosus]MDQ0893097.1 anti-sigma-K factor RskA [Agromyces ramosus]
MTERNQHDDERAGRDDGREAELDSLEAFRGLAAAYALDAVDDDERAAYERAVDESPELRDEADRYAETAALLAALAEPVEPPPAMRHRLMSRLDELPQQSTDAPSSAPPAPEPARQPAPGPAEHAAQRRWFQRPAAILAGAAAAILLIAGAIVGANWPGPNGWGAQREMAAIAAAPDVQTTTHEVPDGGEVTLYWSADEGRSAVVVEGLPDVGDDSTYELWYLDDSGATSAGTFDVQGEETWRVLDGRFAPGVAVGVTVEPAGGSPQPTTEPIVVIET